MRAVQELEFTIEPFVDGEPGPHVLAAVGAAESAGATVTVGPFGSSCSADDAAMPEIVAAVTRAAFANGATVVALTVVARTDSDRSSS